jgi:hypothetical protein
MATDLERLQKLASKGSTTARQSNVAPKKEAGKSSVLSRFLKELGGGVKEFGKGAKFAADVTVKPVGKLVADPIVDLVQRLRTGGKESTATLPFLGEVGNRPFLQKAGTVAEVASLPLGGGVLSGTGKAVAKGGIKGLLGKQGVRLAGESGLAGVLGSGGFEAQRPEATAKSILGQAALGGAIGAAAPPVIGGVGKGLTKLLGKTPSSAPLVKGAVSDILKKPEVDIFDPKAYVKELQSLQDTARTVGAIPTAQGKISNFYKQAKKSTVDFTAPIEDLLHRTQKEFNFNVLPKDNISYQIDKVLRSPILAGQFVRDGGLDSVIKNLGSREALGELDQFMIARQALDVEARGIKTGRNLIKDRQLIAALEGELGPVAEQVRDYSRNLLDYATERGLVSNKLNKQLKAQYPNYVPLNRVFNELETVLPNAPSGKSVASLSSQNVVQKLKGSDRQIESPIASLLAKTDDAFAQGERNEAAKILASYRTLPGWEDIITEVKRGQKVPANQTFSFLEDGVKRTFKTTPEIADVAKNLSAQQFDVLQKIISVPTRALKLGATGVNIAFAGANIVKDRLTAVINSRAGVASSLLNPIHFMDAFLGVTVKRKDVFDDLVRLGAAGNSFDLSRAQVPKTINQILSNKNAIAKAKFVVKNPTQLIRAAEDVIGVSEDLTRLQVFQATKNMLLKQGRTLQDAELIAADEARNVTANFFRRGVYGKAMNAWIPYLNAGIQGNRAFIRALERDPAGTIKKTVATLFMPVAIGTAWNLANPLAREAYLDIPDFEKENNMIIMPPNPTKDENGKWNVVKIPLTPNLGNLASVVRKGIEHVAEADPTSFAEIFNNLLGTLTPVDVSSPAELASTFTPQAIKPSLEVFTNKNFFTKAPIVPRSLDGLPPELQFKDTTSGMAKELGQILKMSPAKVENFIKSTFGGVGSQAIRAVDLALAKVGVIEEDEVGGVSPLENLVGRFSKAFGGQQEALQQEKLTEALQDQKAIKFTAQQTAKDIFEELSTLPPAQANAISDSLARTDPDVFKALEQIVKESKLDLAGSEKRMLTLGVENGARAEFILNHLLNDFKTDEERNARFEELINKRIISSAVESQLRKLKSRQ